MEDIQDIAISRMKAITISREYGSGGGEIASRLSRRLGWQLIDHEVVVRVAKALGVAESEVEAQDEHTDNFVGRMLSSFSFIQSQTPMSMPDSFSTDSGAYLEATQRVVQGAVGEGHVVIVGRGAQVLLGDRRDVFHVRIVAPLEQRLTYVMQREGLSQTAAQSRIHLKDQDRARFLSAQHHNPDNAHLYDMVVNTGILDLDSVVDLLVAGLEAKAKQLDVPAEALGPGSGLNRYPAKPADFTPAEGASSQPGS